MLTSDLHFDDEKVLASSHHYVDGTLPAALCNAINAVAHDARRRLHVCLLKVSKLGPKFLRLSCQLRVYNLSNAVPFGIF